MPFGKPAFLLAMCLSTFLPAFATTYYVCPDGNDLASGTSTNTAWRTIARVNAAKLNAGDTVLFQRGGMWRESIIPQTNKLTYSAWGTGNRPIINAANLLSSGWSKVSSSVWSYAIGAVPPEQVFFNGVLGVRVSQLSSLLAPNQFYFSTAANGNSTLYVYSTANPATAYTAPGVEASQRDAAMLINYAPTLTVEHIEFTNADADDVCLCVGNWGGSGVTFTDDVFSNGYTNGVNIESGYAGINSSELLNNGTGVRAVGGDGFSLDSSIVSGSFNRAVFISNTYLQSYIHSSTISGNATHNPAIETVTNESSTPLFVLNSILLPNPFEPKVFSYSGITDEGNNVYESPMFTRRAAPLIVVPFIDDYINLGVAEAVSALAESYGCHISYALNTKLLGPADWEAVAQLLASGDEIVAHTRSHSDLANNNVFSIQYTGPAATATMTINQTTGVLETFLNGSTTPDLTLPTNNTYNGVIDILGMIPAGSPYTVAIQTNQNFFTPFNLANVSNVDIKTAPYMTQANSNYLTWEVEGAQSDIEANLPGYKPTAFATPYTSSNMTVETHIRNAGFKTNRNGLLNADTSPDGNWLFQSLDVYNMASEWLPYAYDETKPASSAGALVEALGAAGGVMAVYAHGYNEFTLQNWTDLFSNLKSLGATCMTMSQANAYVESQGHLVPDGANMNWVSVVPLYPSFAITPASPAEGARSLQ